MAELKERVTNSFEEHKSELTCGAFGFLLGSLFVYGRIHHQVAKLLKSVGDFLNE